MRQACRTACSTSCPGSVRPLGRRSAGTWTSTPCPSPGRPQRPDVHALLRRLNLKQVSLELGGKSPGRDADAPDLDVAARSVAGGIFFNQGEVCSAGSRLLVHESIRDELVHRVLEVSRQRVVGDPLDPGTDIGALVEAQHLSRVMGYVRGAPRRSAVTLLGGNQVLTETGGYYVEPTIFEASPSMRIAREEIFGQCCRCSRSPRRGGGPDRERHRLRPAASVWTRDLSTAHRMSRQLRAGTVWVNCFDESDITVPFGGYGQSGSAGTSRCTRSTSTPS